MPTRPRPFFEFHISRQARERCHFDGMLLATDGRIVLGDPAAARRLAASLTQARGGTPVASPAEILAMALLDEAMHLAVARYRAQHDPLAIEDALTWFAVRLGQDALDALLLQFCEEFPPLRVHVGEQDARTWLNDESAGTTHRAVALEELMMLWLGNANPACEPYRELFDDRGLAAATAYPRLTALLRDYFETRPPFGAEPRNLIDFLRAPVLAAPHSLFAQLEFVRERWNWLLGGLLARLLTALDVMREEARWFEAIERAKQGWHGSFGGDSSAGAVPSWSRADVEIEAERFSADEVWMPRTVLIAKSTYVWLDQLAKQYGREVTRLDQIPDEELDRLAHFGVNSLWLIGLWERSPASQRIKVLCGNPDAAASAYSLYDYAIAWDLGGEDAWRNLRDRAMARGIRLASDMVPNHMGLDSRWVIEHPEWFLSLPTSPYPSYTFNGPDLSGDDRVELKLDDHYYDRTDAAVVFRRIDRRSGETRFVYHGNDGTSFPWNDTAQLDYLNPAAREQVIQTILAVARRFPVIRFDAAMTLAKRHIQRLWFPEPGAGGAIPSRAGHGLTREAFEQAIPVEFWREVVDRVAVEAPGTLLLAEAFWMMEGYFVRTLGMHRVYNSAFMNMLRDEQNANYRSVIKNTIEFDPDILQRYVNFMNNPDERTAVDQFGRGEKYFGVCTLMATLPGLPMIGHGQIEGYEEKYGMEFRRASRVEPTDDGLVAEHWRRISPLLHRRHLFSGARHFRLFDVFQGHGGVNEDVYAYSNREGDQRALVLVNNRYADAHGWIRMSAAFAIKHGDGGREMRQASLADALALDTRAPFVRCYDLVSGLQHLYRTHALGDQGLHLHLGPYGSRVLLDWHAVHEDGRPWGALCDALEGRGAPSLDDALLEQELAEVRATFGRALDEARAVHATDAAALEGTLAGFEASALAFLRACDRCAHGPGGKHAGLDPATRWSGTAEHAAAFARERAATLRHLHEQFTGEFAPPADARLLPEAGPQDALQAPGVWDFAVALLLAQALERFVAGAATSADPQALTALFDGLRLRAALADWLARRGVNEDERWRIAALVRAAIAHAEWTAALIAPAVFAPAAFAPAALAPAAMAPEAPAPARPAPTAKRTRKSPAAGAPPAPARAVALAGPAAPWRTDADVRWLIGVHEHGGVQWFSREHFTRTLWWLALDPLTRAVRERSADASELAALAARLRQEMAAAEASTWQFEKF